MVNTIERKKRNDGSMDCSDKGQTKWVVPHTDRERTAILGSQAVERVISLRLGTEEAREGIGLEGTGVATVLVNITNVDLDSGVVLGTDEAVSGRASRGKGDPSCIRTPIELAVLVSNIRLSLLVPHPSNENVPESCSRARSEGGKNERGGGSVKKLQPFAPPIGSMGYLDRQSFGGEQGRFLWNSHSF